MASLESLRLAADVAELTTQKAARTADDASGGGGGVRRMRSTEGAEGGVDRGTQSGGEINEICGVEALPREAMTR